MSTKQTTYVKLSLYFCYHTENLDDTFWNSTDANIEKKKKIEQQEQKRIL